MRFVAVLSFLLVPLIAAARSQVSAEGQTCLDCHSSTTPGIVEQWREAPIPRRTWAATRAIVLMREIPQHFAHYGHRIAVIVTPDYCGRRHGEELEQFEKSHQAQAA